MKISISKIQNVDKKYFGERALEYAFGQNNLSRETVIYMSPSEFLKLASPGFDKEKMRDVNKLLADGIPFDEIPYFGVETDEYDNIYVASNGNDHEGRHRVMALRDLGISQIPVKIVSKPYGEGDAFRWGQTQRRPKTLSGYNGYTIKFPKIETYP